MLRRLALSLVAIIVVATPASAQFVVIDPGNLAQVVLIAQRTEQLYATVQDEYQLIQRMAQGIGGLDAYRMPAIGITGHDPSRWPYGGPWLQGMDTGDADGSDYLATVLPLLQPETELATVAPDAREAFERHYASVEIADSVAMLGGHQVALVRGYSDRLQQAIQALEDDTLNPDPAYHQLTANLDKVAAGELLAERQDMAANQLLSHALEQLLARNKSARDTEAGALNMQLVTWRDGAAANEAFVAGTGDALATWREP
jgi:hypothetical protein